jgi:hypothetical protein
MASLLLPLNPLSTVALQSNTNSAYVTAVTETYVSLNTACNVNTAISAAGNTFKFTVLGFNAVAGEKVGQITYKLKAGVNGNISDATVASVVGTRDVGDASPLAATFFLTVRPGAYTSNVMNAAVAGVGYNPRDIGSVNANVSLIGGTTTSSNVILGVSFSGGDGYSNVAFPIVLIEQLA